MTQSRSARSSRSIPSFRSGATACNIAVLALAGIRTLTGTAASSEGLHRALFHQRPIIHVTLMVGTRKILVGSSPDRHRMCEFFRRRASSRARADLPRVGAMSGVLRPVGPESAHTYWTRRGLVFGAAAVLAVAAALIIHGTSSSSEARPNQQPAAHPVGSPTTSSSPTKLQAKPKAKSLDKVYLPQRGPGMYQEARQSVSSRSSHGAMIRYDVRVEDGLSVGPDKAALLIQGVLDDTRSWRGTRRWRFELVPVGQSATLHVYIVTPKTTDRLCAPYLTRGEVSCQNGNRVVLNAKRWVFGVDSYGSDLTNYRRYLVNHEFGHALGKHHLGCPGPGRLAPVMMQQTKGLGACKKNPWPLAGQD